MLNCGLIMPNLLLNIDDARVLDNFNSNNSIFQGCNAELSIRVKKVSCEWRGKNPSTPSQTVPGEILPSFPNEIGFILKWVRHLSPILVNITVPDT